MRKFEHIHQENAEKKSEILFSEGPEIRFEFGNIVFTIIFFAGHRVKTITETIKTDLL